jgi:hypothetical protein
MTSKRRNLGSGCPFVRRTYFLLAHWEKKSQKRDIQHSSKNNQRIPGCTTRKDERRKRNHSKRSKKSNLKPDLDDIKRGKKEKQTTVLDSPVARSKYFLTLEKKSKQRRSNISSISQKQQRIPGYTARKNEKENESTKKKARDRT